MLPLILISIFLMGTSVGLSILFKKKIQSEKGKYWLFLIASLLTIAVHYSSLIYHLIKDGECGSYLSSNPNLVLPIYPCNVVMICCLIFGLMKNKNNKFSRFLSDFCVFFGIISSVVGMLANVDFIRNPTLADYDITKGILAHGTMFFNVIAMAIFGYTKIDLPNNMIRFTASAVMLGVIGLHDSAIIYAFSGKDYMNVVNPMFMLHSPFEGVDFLVFPIIAIIAIVLVFALLVILEAIKYRNDKDNIWYKRIKNKK